MLTICELTNCIFDSVLYIYTIGWICATAGGEEDGEEKLFDTQWPRMEHTMATGNYINMSSN